MTSSFDVRTRLIGVPGGHDKGTYDHNRIPLPRHEYWQSPGGQVIDRYKLLFITMDGYPRAFERHPLFVPKVGGGFQQTDDIVIYPDSDEKKHDIVGWYGLESASVGGGGGGGGGGGAPTLTVLAFSRDANDFVDTNPIKSVDPTAAQVGNSIDTTKIGPNGGFLTLVRAIGIEPNQGALQFDTSGNELAYTGALQKNVGGLVIAFYAFRIVAPHNEPADPPYQYANLFLERTLSVLVEKQYELEQRLAQVEKHTKK